MDCHYPLRQCEVPATWLFLREGRWPIPLCDQHKALAERVLAGGAPGQLVPIPETLPVDCSSAVRPEQTRCRPVPTSPWANERPT